MTDLTGILTSTGLPLQPGLQHNPVAAKALRQLRIREDHANSDAVHAAQALGLAEYTVESLKMRIHGAEQRAQQWQHAAAGLPEIVRSEMPSPVDVDAVRQDLTAAEANLAEARREHARTAAILLDVHNAAEALQRHIYAPSPDPEEVPS